MKKWFFILLASLPFGADAANTCGDDLGNNCWDCGRTSNDLCTARLNGTSLAITGTGEMADYQAYGNPPIPWGTGVTNVDIQGITSIGLLAFGGTQISDLLIPASVIKLKNGALQTMPELTSVRFEEGSKIETIGGANFFYDGKLSTVVLPEGVQEIGFNNAYNTNLKELYLPDSLFHEDGTIGLDRSALTAGLTIYCSEKNQTKFNEWLKDAVYYIGNSNYLSLKDTITIETYQKDDGMYILNGNYYASFNEMQKGEDFACTDLTLCKAKALENKGYCTGDACMTMAQNCPITYQNKTYASINDLLSGNYIPKRIYTIDEANAVAGEKNRVSIKYR